MMIGAIRDVATSTPRAKAGGLLLRPALRGFRDEIDPEGPGGAYLLGLRRLGVVPHGRFTRFGFSQAILLAARGVTADVVGRTHGALDAAGALRRDRPQRAKSSQRAGSDDDGSSPSDPRLRCPRHDSRRGVHAHPHAPGRRARRRPGGDLAGEPVQGGPVGGQPRSLHARAGARGLLRRTDVRRAGGARSSASDRRSISCSSTRRPDADVDLLRALLDDLPDDLSRQVFTHTSWTDRSSDSYERLAFLGDSVLGLAITAHLYPRLEAERYGAGRLTKIRAQTVSGSACRQVAERLGVPDRMRAVAPEGRATAPSRSRPSGSSPPSPRRSSARAI